MILCLTHEYGYTSHKELYSQENGTWSEMGKHCHVTKKVFGWVIQHGGHVVVVVVFWGFFSYS